MPLTSYSLGVCPSILLSILKCTKCYVTLTRECSLFHCDIFHWEVKVASHVQSLQPHGLYSPQNSPGQNTGMGSLSLIQRIFPIQGSNPGLLLCRRILYQLSHKGSPRILEWVAYPFSSRSSWPGNQSRISSIAGRFFLPTELSGKPILHCKERKKRKWSHSVIADSLWPHGL